MSECDMDRAMELSLHIDPEVAVEKMWPETWVGWRECFEEVGYPTEHEFDSEALSVSYGVASAQEKGALLMQCREESVAEILPSVLAFLERAVNGHCFELWDGDALVGLLGINGSIARMGAVREILLQFDGVYVVPDRRGKHLGTALMSTVADEAFSAVLDEAIDAETSGMSLDISLHMQARSGSDRTPAVDSMLEYFFYGEPFHAEELEIDAEIRGSRLRLNPSFAVSAA